MPGRYNLYNATTGYHYTQMYLAKRIAHVEPFQSSYDYFLSKNSMKLRYRFTA